MGGSRLELLKNFPYRRLTALLDGIEPAQSPLFLQIGEPQDAVPDMVLPTVTANAAHLGKYPPPNGAPDYNEAVARWIEGRYGLEAGAVDPVTQVTALCGTREGLFQAALMAIIRKRERMRDPGIAPAVLVPNPMYHVYFGGAVVGDADPILLNATAENGFLPDYAGLPESVLDRTAICYLCTPGNPTGAVASPEAVRDLLALARKHDFVLAVDECYSEIWFDRAPAGGFDAAQALGGTENLLVFNSLSKRSGSPGLRCGFVAGDPELVEAMTLLRSYGGAQVPGALMAAGTALWRDEAHAVANRERYHNLVQIADHHLSGIPGYRKPEAGFFLWMDVSATFGDGEAAARRLWADAGVKALPGRYMARPDPSTDASPGDAYLRLALVHDPDTVARAMERVAGVFSAA
ncbi:MAG: aminotransferase class I/II-fold pyridoxal phosphate-dependent enzyme [Alphaproteobacteria bacterium]|nr:aminotransferase class I/II-fold pyridoxal phosphate-dependent enzyme [Alphaproteobacteria bacterium]